CTRVEDVGRLEQRDLLVRKAAKDRFLLRERLFTVGARDAKAAAEPPTAPAVAVDGRRRWRALLHPARVERGLLAEWADLDELCAIGRREAHGTLAEEQRPLTDRARMRDRDLRDPHGASVARLRRVSGYR